MQSKQKPYLRLVWPPVATGGDLDVSSSTLEQALRNDGWRSVSFEDLRNLPPDEVCTLQGYKIEGRMTWWLKAAEKYYQ